MLILLPAGILVATAIFMVVMQRRDSGRGMIWSSAVAGSVAAIIVSFIMVRFLPLELQLRAGAVNIYNRLALTLTLDGTSWAYQTVLLAILSAVLLTAARRTTTSGPPAWLTSISISILGLVAVQAGSLPALLGAWFLIDTLELVFVLVLFKSHHDIGKLVTGFVLRFAGILVAMMAIPVAGNQPNSMGGLPILLAAMLRMGALPFWSYWGEASTRTGVGTMMQAVRALSALTPLAHLDVEVLPVNWTGLFTLYCLLLMLYCAIRWLSLNSAGDGRAYWITGCIMVAAVCVIHGQAAASVPWVVTYMLAGSALFLFTDRTRLYLILSLAGLVALTGLPFTPVTSGWSGLLGEPVDWRATPFILGNVLFLAGSLRLAIKTPEPERRIEGIARFSYPAGLVTLLVMPWLIIMVSINETPLEDWWAGFITFALLLVIIIVFRDQLFEGVAFRWPSGRFWNALTRLSEGSLNAIQQGWMIALINRIAGWIGRLTGAITFVMEGDGGILWVFLLLVIFVSLIAKPGTL